jgi:hypothetical protein
LTFFDAADNNRTGVAISELDRIAKGKTQTALPLSRHQRSRS